MKKFPTLSKQPTAKGANLKSGGETMPTCKDLGTCESEAMQGTIDQCLSGVDIHILVAEIIGPGAIPIDGREKRKAPCECCIIDPKEPTRRMCTTKGAIGTLSKKEVGEWCSEITVVSDGRCERARGIKEAAAECREKHPHDTTGFFQCFAPAFGKLTKTK